ncbi:MAG TPA: SemiSWEET transporter [Syntrophales bacterium]|mgnify:CR=1 FL=1|nr:SemiSWEET transporter [Syntrophales bacterium]HPQ43471.1 SemiSWEET transporter [Syntrophales bacterium]
MNIETIIGFMAALLSAISMAPQVVKIYRTKKTSDLSLGAFGTLATGLFLWLVYGLLIHSLPVVVGNGIGFTITTYIIIMKIRHG